MGPQAGLFSAVTSTFITEVGSQLQPNPNEETAALLRVLIYKVDDTTFGGDVPTVPQWSGPPSAIIQVQAILYASLATSLFSAFLAMLGKQWLNQYASTDMRGTAIERSQNRQRKLKGIIDWYFEYVMESLPLMLQAALLLLGCALCRYLWGINTIVASVVLGVTSSGVIFYLFIIVAGTASESCPYQTPGSRILRSTPSAITSAVLAIASNFRHAIRHSETAFVFQGNVEQHWPLQSRNDVISFLKGVFYGLPGALAIDTYHLGIVVAQPLVTVTHPLYTHLFGVPSTPTYGSGQQATSLDLQCISWMLQTSLDKSIHLSTLKSLATIVALAGFDPSLVADCFTILSGCIMVINDTVVVTQGLEQLASVSAICLLHTFSHLSVMDPASGVLVDVQQRYNRVFLPRTNFNGFPFCHALGAIHGLLNSGWRHQQQARVEWQNHKPSSHEHIIFSHALAKLAWSEYQRRGRREKKVPRWILRFVLHSLSSSPLPPTSVVVNCLSIIAIDLGCDTSTTRNMVLHGRYANTQ